MYEVPRVEAAITGTNGRIEVHLLGDTSSDGVRGRMATIELELLVAVGWFTCEPTMPGGRMFHRRADLWPEFEFTAREFGKILRALRGFTIEPKVDDSVHKLLRAQ